MRILHVDDDPDFADIVTTFLEREDERFSVTSATSAAEALDVIAGQPPHCIVSDYNMPGRDGIELLRSVRHEWPELPFILFTGKGSEAVASKAISAGVTDYLQKGTGSEQYELLANRIINAVSHHRAKSNYREIFDKTEIGLVIDDPETGTILDANQAYADITGHDREDIIGKNPAELSPESSSYSEADAVELIDEAIEAGPRAFEWLHETESGDERWAEVTLKSVVINGQQRVLASVVDITDRKERERKLRREQQWRTAIFEGSRDAVFISDTDANFIEVNEAAVELTGYDRDELLSMAIPDLHDDPELDVYREYHERILSGEPATTEADVRRPDGSKVPVEFSSRRIEVDDDIYMHTVARDITDRRERERELRKAREQFTDGVPHGFFLVAADYSETYYVNSKVEDLYGISVEEAYTDPATWLRHVHPDDVERLRGDMETHRTGGLNQPQNQQFRIQHPERGTRLLEVNIYPIENDGETDRLAGIVTDVTKQKEMTRTSPRA